ncbi:uncharacterized protein ACLA_084080 [Aspergillus clavatus NRRL 1]|uniref:Uncharacterized protein n=1 Tax=Aspergillus clavatus (strain ATCC 1007 / CBS 513.65 / DSM 816 / NCTC 3887 / NRRL 1 / QM 1276 / 107) TaxID=344612 RepID=A1CTS6_ASPCL|nr:uncharacterized protein ACLA_084080 [Aspergillus clavatus NRRL 1]EAW06713.1 conserved hypothetical protein [Aspergillus clavatus NRRL 1]
MVLSRPQIIRISLRAVGASARRPIQQAGRRTYASAADSKNMKKSSNFRWLMASVGLSVPAAFYIMQTGPASATPSHGHHGEGRLTEIPPVKPEQRLEKVPENTKPSSIDEAASRKPPAGDNTMSTKQEGLDNTDTANPFVADPGKSMKGEGETDSVKLKGTIDPSRPQR